MGIQKNKLKILIIGMSIVIIILIPIFLHYVIFQNNVLSNVSNDGWASFFGSYFGGALGGVLTLAGVRWTILEQKRESRIKEKPILILMKKGNLKSLRSEEEKLGYASIVCQGNIKRFEDMVLRNIGIKGVQSVDILIGDERLRKIQNIPILTGEDYELPALIYQGGLGDTISITLVYRDFNNNEYITVINCNVDHEQLIESNKLIYISEVYYKRIAEEI